MRSDGQKAPFAIRNVRMFVVFRVFFNARFYYPVFTILFLDFGLTLSQFALLNAVWAATIVLLEVPSGALADTIGRRNLLVAAGGFMVAEMLLLLLVPVGNAPLIFAAFLINRIFSGAAEAAASGADEAIAYDALKNEGDVRDWGRVLEWQMRMKAIAYIAAMSVGAAVYDPDLVGAVTRWLGLGGTVTQETTLKLPIFLTLGMALVTLWSALRMREVETGSGNACQTEAPCGTSIIQAFRLTLRAGLWICRTPFALVVILFGLLFDHVIRMIMTISSQYYRLIDLPEAAFGLIGSGMAVLGIFIPRMARYLAENHTPLTNLGLIGLMTVVGLSGMVPFFPVAGLLPVILLSGTMYFVTFFTSHYLNHMTDSSQRATVLSFKGLSFNLAYGLIGILFSLLLAHLRGDAGLAGLGETDLENRVFVRSIAWFPGYFALLLIGLAAFARRRLQHSREHRHPISQATDGSV